MVLSACTTNIGATASDQAKGDEQIKQYDLLERLDAVGIESVRYIDNETIYISAYNNKKENEADNWELILARYNTATDELYTFYRDFESTDYLRNIYVSALQNGNEVIFNGATLFYLNGNNVFDSITIDKAYRRETYFNLQNKVMAMIHPDKNDLYYWSLDSEEPQLIYKSTLDEDGRIKQMPFYPVISPSGSKILFQLVGSTASEITNLIYYNIQTGKIDFNIDINAHSEIVEHVWLGDDRFYTWEPSDSDGRHTFITYYDTAGEVLSAYSINGMITQIQTGQNLLGTTRSALIYDGYDEEQDELLFSLAVLDISDGTAKCVHNSKTVVFSQDLSPNTEKIIWVEGDMIYEMFWSQSILSEYDVN